MVEHDMQMHRHDGEWFQSWRRRMAASVGAVLLEDLEREQR